jgi:biotin carboxyl carrier protein
MTEDAQPLEPASAEQTWHELDTLVEESARLSRLDIPRAKFCAELLERVVTGLGAVGGAVWTRGLNGRVQQEYQLNPAHPWLADHGDGGDRHGRQIELVLSTGKARLVPPRRQPTAEDPVCNPTGFLLILCPWIVDRVPAGVLEVFQRPDGGPQAEQGYLKFAEVMSELVADYDRNCQLRSFRREAADSGRLQQFVRDVHGSFDLLATAYTIANEGRRLLECDRLSVLVCRGRRYRLLAISGVDTFHRRANVVRRLERLTRAVAATGEPLWYPDSQGDRAAVIEELLSAYLDESHVRSIAIVPLLPDATEPSSQPRQAVGVLVAESFCGGLDARQRALLLGAGTHVALALRNTLEWEAVPFVHLLRRVRGWMRVRSLLKGTLALACAAGILAAIVLSRTDFDIRADGELQPQGMRDVFARTDGVVSDLRVEHGERVQAGQLLAVLRRPQLDFEFKQVWGELQTARQKLAGVEAERLQLPRETEEQRRHYSQLTAQDEELHEGIRSLEAQYAVLQQKQSECEVRSPMQGQVLTWNVQQLLEDRPVQRGQVLLTVGDLSGPWRLELRVPDRHAAYVLQAQQERGEHLEVAYLLTMQPGTRLRGTIRQMGMRSEVLESGEACVMALVDIDRESLPELVPGAGVKAAISCGRRSVGYVWLHDFLDAIRTWFFF